MSNAVTDRRFILTLVDKVTLLFPALLVVETLLIDRSQILSLPFYNPAFLGCVYTGGRVIPLLYASPFLGLPIRQTNQVLTVVQLGESAEHLAGVGIVVEQMLGSHTEISQSQTQETDTPAESKIKLFNPELIGRDIFQPQRWSSVEFFT